MTQSSTQPTAQARKLFNRALALHEIGDLEGAEQIYLDVIDLNYAVAEILPLLAGIASERGNINSAKSYWQELLRLTPDHLLGQMELGYIFANSGHRDEAIQHFRNAMRICPDNPVVLNNLAVTLYDAQQLHESLAVFEKLAVIQPENFLVQHQIKRLTSAIVPFWHVPMMNDHRRNDAFEAAIVKALAKHENDAQILDIGTGSGLLSMFAARAGATNIVTCEMVSTLATAAEKIIATNGFADHITVHNKTSNDLIIGNDIPVKADILVSEILSSDLLAENVLGTFEDAHARLLNKNATIIPQAASAIGCLVESEVLSQYCFVQNVSGFDVSAFAPLAPQRLPVHGSMTDWQRLSPDVNLLTIDLKQPHHPHAMAGIEIPVTKSGRCAGVVQWLKIDLIEDVTFENHPDEYSDGGWLQIFHPFPSPITVQAGSKLQMVAGHDRSSLILMPVLESSQELETGKRIDKVA